MSDFAQRPGVAVVIGGSGGIGQAICRGLVREGAQVAFTYRSNRAGAEALAAELSQPATACTAHELDLRDPAAARGFIESVGSVHGAIHTLVYAAGPHVPMVHLSQVSPEQMRDQVEQDVLAFFNIVHPALPYLRDSSGSIVAVTTAATSRYPRRDGLSSGPKAAVESIARGLASEEGRYGVRVNCIGPGMLTDGMASRLIESQDLDQSALKVTHANIPLGRFGRADDVAHAALFLASDRAGYITGQKLDIDGGYTV